MKSFLTFFRYDLLTFEPFHYLCKNVVLASGSSDLPNSLGIPGELNTENRNWLTHDVREFERQIEELDEENVKGNSNLKNSKNFTTRNSMIDRLLSFFLYFL